MEEYFKRKKEVTGTDDRSTALSNSTSTPALNAMTNNSEVASYDSLPFSGKDGSSPKAEGDPSVRGSMQNKTVEHFNYESTSIVSN